MGNEISFHKVKHHFHFFVCLCILLIFLIFRCCSLLSCFVWLFVTSWTAPCQDSLFFTLSQSLPKLMSTELVMLSSRLIFCCPILHLPSVFPSIRVFSNELALRWGGQSIGVSASAPVLPMSIQTWFPLGFTGLISLQSKEFSCIYGPTLTSVNDYWRNHNFDYTDLWWHGDASVF